MSTAIERLKVLVKSMNVNASSIKHAQLFAWQDELASCVEALELEERGRKANVYRLMRGEFGDELADRFIRSLHQHPHPDERSARTGTVSVGGYRAEYEPCKRCGQHDAIYPCALED